MSGLRSGPALTTSGRGRVFGVPYPLGLFQLLVQLLKGLIVLVPHVGHLLLVRLGVVLQSLLQLSHFALTLVPAHGEEGFQKLWNWQDPSAP